jgi:hypothetical protein
MMGDKSLRPPPEKQASSLRKMSQSVYKIMLYGLLADHGGEYEGLPAPGCSLNTKIPVKENS